ncbi:MAG: hypothetical protein A2284_17665 [Deltaproteobacteria bacterium RIFOXYA12_FULL_61_11]|nr:MAG: hypothetical protein A2284_17665 [Deltaproteobacteria bacterium RIFOXYA12_FULL_61_11]
MSSFSASLSAVLFLLGQGFLCPIALAGPPVEQFLEQRLVLYEGVSPRVDILLLVDDGPPSVEVGAYLALPTDQRPDLPEQQTFPGPLSLLTPLVHPPSRETHGASHPPTSSDKDEVVVLSSFLGTWGFHCRFECLKFGCGDRCTVPTSRLRAFVLLLAEGLAGKPPPPRDDGTAGCRLVLTGNFRFEQVLDHLPGLPSSRTDPRVPRELDGLGLVHRARAMALLLEAPERYGVILERNRRLHLLAEL